MQQARIRKLLLLLKGLLLLLLKGLLLLLLLLKGLLLLLLLLLLHGAAATALAYNKLPGMLHLCTSVFRHQVPVWASRARKALPLRGGGHAIVWESTSFLSEQHAAGSMKRSYSRAPQRRLHGAGLPRHQ